MRPTDPIQRCTCCGATELAASKVLWDGLIEEWGLAPHEAQYIDRQQGLRCKRCSSNLRTMALALAICRCYGYEGTFSQFVKERRFRRLRVLEINEAGQLTQFLVALRRYTPARYPGIDMMRMPYSDQSFDLVVHSDTLEHVAEPIMALSECRRVLTAGGYCVFTVPVVVDRMTRSRRGLPPSYHGAAAERAADFVVQTEYGCDAWKHVICAGFRECRLVTPEFPAALAFAGVRWS